MVLIEIIIKPFKVDDVKEALEELGIGGMTVIEVMQTTPPRPKGRSFGSVTASDLVPKIKLQIAAPRNLTESIIEAVCLHGSTGKNEDGKLMVQKVEQVIRIRTGDMNDEALS